MGIISEPYPFLVLMWWATTPKYLFVILFLFSLKIDKNRSSWFVVHDSGPHGRAESTSLHTCLGKGPARAARRAAVAAAMRPMFNQGGGRKRGRQASWRERSTTRIIASDARPHLWLSHSICIYAAFLLTSIPYIRTAHAFSPCPRRRESNKTNLSRRP